MAGERLEFLITGDSASAARAFRSAADSALLASRGARQLSESLNLQSKSTQASIGATLALARSDKTLADAERLLSGAADEAGDQLRQQGRAAEEAAVKTRLAGTAASGAGGGFAALGGTGGMGAAIAAGVALSPVLVTVATGLGGLALAGYGVAKPIEEAAKKSGGLAANLKLLDPEQRAVAQGILALGKQYDQFQQALKPEVLGLFGEGVQIAGHVLRDIQPVAAATGKALNAVLGRVDTELQSGTWQQFFGFIAREAGPDVQLLGNLFVDLAHDLPALLEALQPVAVQVLKSADAILKLISAGEQADDWLKRHKQAADNSAGAWGLFAHAVERAVGDLLPGIPVLGQAKGWLDKMSGSSGGAGKALNIMGGSAAGASKHVLSLAQQVTGLTNAENSALSPLLGYTNALISQGNDAAALNAALKASHDRIGLNTAAQRASFGAANTYIQDLLNTASAAGKSGQGIDTQIASIKTALPLLQHARGGTKDYWHEVQALTGWLGRLQAMKAIHERIAISGSGTWAMVQGGGRLTGPGMAAGGLVTGPGGPRSDSVPVMLSPGEFVISAASAQRIGYGLLGGLNKMADGGIVGSYSGALKGLQPWGQHNWSATVAGITAGVARALSAALGGGSGTPGGGGYSASARQAQAFALSLMAAHGWGPAQWPPLLSLWNRESGWSATARNPSSGAAGIPQDITGNFHGGYRGQVIWGENYIAGRYGTPAAAWAHELAAGWYDRGGSLPPGLSLALNTTGRPEQVIPARAAGGSGDVHVHVSVNAPIGSQAEMENWFVRTMNAAARKGQLRWALRQSPSA